MRFESRWIKDFKCSHCHRYVSTDPLLSGVKNRNHCPYCLWSKHLDLYQAGDRLSACKAGMQPAGLALKRSRKKYGQVQGGELMLIHLCTGCGSVSINRIAADDDAERIYEVFEHSLTIDDHHRTRLAASGVLALEVCDLDLVSRRLFGASIDKTGYSLREDVFVLEPMYDEGW
jgi:hypothetical protein